VLINKTIFGHFKTTFLLKVVFSSTFRLELLKLLNSPNVVVGSKDVYLDPTKWCSKTKEKTAHFTLKICFVEHIKGCVFTFQKPTFVQVKICTFYAKNLLGRVC